MQRFFLLLVSFLCAGGAFLLLDIGSLALAQDVPLNQGMIRDIDNPENVSDATSYHGSFREAVLTIVNYFLYFVGLVGVVMIIFAGFLYMTSGGEDNEKGKKIVLYVAVGVILILVSFALVNTLLGSGDAGGAGQN